jgi:hypothetical protein
MKAWVWLRSLAILLALFAVGHTLGTAAPRVRRGPEEAAVFDAMRRFRFPIMGFNRTHWDFYRGFAITISVLLVVLAVITWQIGTVSRCHPRQALPMAIAVQLGCLGLLAVGWMFFFGAPIVMSGLAVLGASVGSGLLAREVFSARRSA